MGQRAIDQETCPQDGRGEGVAVHKTYATLRNDDMVSADSLKVGAGQEIQWCQHQSLTSSPGLHQKRPDIIEGRIAKRNLAAPVLLQGVLFLGPVSRQQGILI